MGHSSGPLPLNPHERAVALLKPFGFPNRGEGGASPSGGRGGAPRNARRKGWYALALLCGLAGCAAQPLSQSLPHDLVNVGDAHHAARVYHDDGRYDRDVAAVVAQADAWVVKEAGAVRKPALVLDIDETSLSNWPEIKADDFGYFHDGACDTLPHGPCGALAWESRGEAPAILPTLGLVQDAQRRGVTVFFVTGRWEDEREPTAQNLTRAGYRNWAALYLKPNGMIVSTAAAYKAPVRARIEAQGYTIIANMGDQPSDLAGGHAERGFLLPNPFYRVP